jgi:hypothetical protein
VLVYTTSDGTPLRVYQAAPSLNGLSILLNNGASATDTEAARQAVADMALTYQESARLTVVGY